MRPHGIAQLQKCLLLPQLRLAEVLDCLHPGIGDGPGADDLPDRDGAQHMLAVLHAEANRRQCTVRCADGDHLNLPVHNILHALTSACFCSHYIKHLFVNQGRNPWGRICILWEILLK